MISHALTMRSLLPTPATPMRTTATPSAESTRELVCAAIQRLEAQGRGGRIRVRGVSNKYIMHRTAEWVARREWVPRAQGRVSFADAVEPARFVRSAAGDSSISRGRSTGSTGPATDAKVNRFPAAAEPVELAWDAAGSKGVSLPQEVLTPQARVALSALSLQAGSVGFDEINSDDVLDALNAGCSALEELTVNGILNTGAGAAHSQDAWMAGVLGPVARAMLSALPSEAVVDSDQLLGLLNAGAPPTTDAFDCDVEVEVAQEFEMEMSASGTKDAEDESEWYASVLSAKPRMGLSVLEARARGGGAVPTADDVLAALNADFEELDVDELFAESNTDIRAETENGNETPAWVPPVVDLEDIADLEAWSEGQLAVIDDLIAESTARLARLEETPEEHEDSSNEGSSHSDVSMFERLLPSATSMTSVRRSMRAKQSKRCESSEASGSRATSEDRMSPAKAGRLGTWCDREIVDDSDDEFAGF
ncbi:hypothetical protein B0H11DRAFT_1950712, partial [Mycena galericulata]